MINCLKRCGKGLKVFCGNHLGKIGVAGALDIGFMLIAPSVWAVPTSVILAVNLPILITTFTGVMVGCLDYNMCPAPATPTPSPGLSGTNPHVAVEDHDEKRPEIKIDPYFSSLNGIPTVPSNPSFVLTAMPEPLVKSHLMTLPTVSESAAKSCPEPLMLSNSLNYLNETVRPGDVNTQDNKNEVVIDTRLRRKSLD